MLTELIVTNLGVIERAELALAPGCSVVTGETGVGKTLMVAGLPESDRAREHARELLELAAESVA